MEFLQWSDAARESGCRTHGGSFGIWCREVFNKLMQRPPVKYCSSISSRRTSSIRYDKTAAEGDPTECNDDVFATRWRNVDALSLFLLRLKPKYGFTLLQPPPRTLKRLEPAMRELVNFEATDSNSQERQCEHVVSSME